LENTRNCNKVCWTLHEITDIWDLMPCSLVHVSHVPSNLIFVSKRNHFYFFTLRKQAWAFSLMLAPIYQTVRHHILESCNLIPSWDSQTLWYKGELNVYLESVKKLRPWCMLLQAQEVFSIGLKLVLCMVGLVKC
jgi:hypothetical protein